MPLMGLKEYARHRGCFPRAVEAALAAGRIRRDERGLIDSEQADLDWLANTNPHRSAASKLNGHTGQTIRRKLAGKAEAPHSEPPLKPPVLAQESRRIDSAADAAHTPTETDISEYAKARAEREHYQAKLAKLSYDERLGRLLPADPVRSVIEASYRVVRDKLLAIPDRMPELSFDDRHRLESELIAVLGEFKLENLMRAIHGDSQS